MKDKKSPKNNSEKSFNTNENKDVKELTHKALVSFLREQIKDKVASKKDIDALTSQILEFLNCCILLGYNIEGEPISMISAHNQQEADSLGALLNKFLYNSTRDGSGD